MLIDEQEMPQVTETPIQQIKIERLEACERRIWDLCIIPWKGKFDEFKDKKVSYIY